jgi:hypothetical protein
MGFLKALIEAIPYKIYIVLTDSIQFADLPKNRPIVRVQARRKAKTKSAVKSKKTTQSLRHRKKVQAKPSSLNCRTEHLVLAPSLE